MKYIQKMQYLEGLLLIDDLNKIIHKYGFNIEHRNIKVNNNEEYNKII